MSAVGSERVIGIAKSMAGIQPNAGARFLEMLSSKLPVDPWLPLTAVEQADRSWLQPVSAWTSRFYSNESIEDSGQLWTVLTWVSQVNTKSCSSKANQSLPVVQKLF